MPAAFFVRLKKDFWVSMAPRELLVLPRFWACVIALWEILCDVAYARGRSFFCSFGFFGLGLRKGFVNA